MKFCLSLVLLLCSGMLRVGSGLRCYRCSDYTGRCENVQECTFEDSCISLSERAVSVSRWEDDPSVHQVHGLRHLPPHPDVLLHLQLHLQMLQQQPV
ncbi:CD59 glycoprotein isoform X2 [Kryptolebias marmoratus]|uniref:CD59 glycoprotein isoform X2 n=1 Tax=Kryptolebias marmoratus TaxID=37003 RepID=UPI0018ACC1B7|nr:CD59 glycoprotein isoform X2 [Kryptolebias marmoratus]